jgi:hypothetical protein
VLTWIHPNGAPLCRSAQPLTGITDKYGVEDDLLLVAMQEAVKFAQARVRAGPGGGGQDGGAPASNNEADENIYCFHDVTIDEDCQGNVGCMANEDDLWMSVSVDLSHATKNSLPLNRLHANTGPTNTPVNDMLQVTTRPRTSSSLPNSPVKATQTQGAQPQRSLPPPLLPKLRSLEESIALAAGSSIVSQPQLQKELVAGDHVDQEVSRPLSAPTVISGDLQNQRSSTIQQLQAQIQGMQTPAPTQIQTPMLRIIDCRALWSATGNVFIGKGYENVNRHTQIGCVSITFEGIGNIHAVRESFQKYKACVCVRSAQLQRHELAERNKHKHECESVNKQTQAQATVGGNYWTGVHDSKWLHHVSDVGLQNF